MRMTAGCAITPPPATSPSCAKSLSPCSPATAAFKPAFAAGAKRPPGTTTICSGSSPARLMREPCPGNTADSTVLDEITRHLVGKLYADKGYIGQDLFKTLWQRGLHLITGIRRNMRNY